MGVKTQTVTPSLVQQAHLSVKTGAYVAQITPGEGAARAKMRVGDVIIVVDGHRVTTNDEVLSIVRRHQPQRDGGVANHHLCRQGQGFAWLRCSLLGELPASTEEDPPKQVSHGQHSRLAASLRPATDFP